MKQIKEWYKYWLVEIVLMLILTFGWQGLELYFYGEVQYRVVDDIIGLFFMISIGLNVAFVKLVRDLLDRIE